MPTALDAGWYSSKGFRARRHRQYVRATGLPPPSTWASAARNSGVMTAVECLLKSVSYVRHVSDGLLMSASLTGKNSSVGLRIVWYPQLTADQATTMTTAPTRIRTASGAPRIARSARRRHRAGRRLVARPDRTRGLRGAALAARECDLEAMRLFYFRKRAGL